MKNGTAPFVFISIINQNLNLYFPFNSFVEFAKK